MSTNVQFCPVYKTPLQKTALETNEMAEYLRICNFCFKEYIAQKNTTRFCCHKCSSRGYKMRKRLDNDQMFSDQDTMKRLLIKMQITMEKLETLLEELPKLFVQNKKQLLTPTEFCETINIHRKTLDRMIGRNQIETQKIGKRIFIDSSELQKVKIS